MPGPASTFGVGVFGVAVFGGSGVLSPGGFSVGRVGLSISLGPPVIWAQQGATITVDGTVLVSPNTDAVRLRDQFLGYQDNLDEPIVPVIIGVEPRLNGYYRVLSVNVTTDQKALSVGALTYNLTLERVMGFAQPVFESILSGALLTNAVGAVIADAYPFHVVPSVSTEYGGYGVTGSGFFYIRSSADGNLQIYTPVTGGGIFSGSPRFSLAPASFYVGAATFEQGSPLQPVVGRSLTQSDLVNWRLSNGLVRVLPNAQPGVLDVYHWRSASWASAKSYQITGTNGSGPINLITGVSLLRNSPEETIIRLACQATAIGPFNRINVDLALRRGDRLVRGYLTADTADKWQVARYGSVEAATAIAYGSVASGGMRATANDGDSNRFVLLSYQAATASDLANDKLTQSANSTTFDFAIGSEIGGSAALNDATAISLAKQYISAQSESQRIVAR